MVFSNGGPNECVTGCDRWRKLADFRSFKKICTTAPQEI